MPKSRKRAPEEEIARIAREKLGFESLRPGQSESVAALLEGRDTLVVQPTGSGKSAIYQIAGLMLDGSTVVVSPLIALQKDQIDAIRERGIEDAEALAVNSAKPASEVREAWESVALGEVEYIFLAPEQLRKRETLERLKQANVSLFVVDEAHCISQWGHDFRPDYLGLGNVIKALRHPRVLALTATASAEVRSEIAERLGMRRPKVIVQGFDRPNIYLRVDAFGDKDEKREALLHRVMWADKPGIVYAGTRKSAEAVMGDLAAQGVNASFYHAGLGARDRESIQERFMSGEVDVIVATNAFGLGVDKPDIRFVYHYDAPESLESYYQEIGRAGRDGKQSEAILFYRPEDIGAQSFKTGNGHIQPEALEKIARSIAEAGGAITPEEVAAAAGLTQRKLTAALHRLKDAGAIETLSNGKLAARNGDLSRAVVAATESHGRLREARRRKLEEMRAYAESAGCRREILLRNLGDDFEGPCGFCDNCGAVEAQAAAGAVGVRREVV